jgi:hypothetical protein
VGAVAGCAAALLLAGPAGAGMAAPRIEVLSNRADLVSGGDALVRVTLPAGVTASRLRLTAGRRDVTKDLQPAGTGRLEGLIEGLRVGRTALTARVRDGSAARLWVTNHPIGGPVFSGPQLKPWTCQASAVDQQCNQPAGFSYLYKSTDSSKQGLQSYDPANPPSDVAQTTTDQGVTVPFIVRLEIGYMDRDQYKIATLFQPDKPWTPLEPQSQFNHKLLITHGASCGIEYRSASAPNVLSGAAETALARGFVTMSTALDNSGHNCNVAVQAESLIMAKERIAERYGPLRYTIGTGCSGGSLAQQWIANAYPGVYQGILPTCSFPDAGSSATQVVDYALIEHYLLDPSTLQRGVVWSPTQWAALEGNLLPVDALLSVGCLNPNPPYNDQTCPTGYYYAAIPTWHCPGLTDQQRYDPVTNPGGSRCSIVDLNRNLLGPRSPDVWSAPEKKIGRGFTGVPLDNIGVQYGLDALRSGQITPAQFADLNAHIGGGDVDANPRPERLVADRPALANSYRTGIVNETNNLDRTAIIDCRGPDPGAAHDSYRAFAVRARLDREHGSHANQLIWEGPTPIVADAQCEVNSFLAMDRWLAAVEKDARAIPLAGKVREDKPADLSDRCYDGTGDKVSDGLCGEAIVPVYGTPRTVAGQPITTDIQKCRLKPMRRGDYGVSFSDDQWAQLQRAFPDGVCDFGQPGVDQQPTIAWQTYQDVQGNVIYGGRAMGPAPKSHRIRSLAAPR